MFSPKRNQSTEEYERRKNKEKMLDNSDIEATMKGRRISWTENVWRGQEQIIEHVTKRIP